MNILVCVSKTPDTTAKISVSGDGKSIDENGMQYIMNPYDEWYALVRALELQESANTGKVATITVGTAGDDPIIRKGLAIGAHEAVRIDAEPKSAYFVAAQIAEYAKNNPQDIIFTGKETIDYHGSEVGAMLAEVLDLPFISYASHMEVSGKTATITRDIEGGVEVVEVDMPFVVSAAKGLAEQRIANMKGIMTAKSKPLTVVPPVAIDEKAMVVSYDAPPAKSAVKLIDPENMDELVRLLHEEAKVI